MGIRVEPHAYPTIPGQATNENPGGGAGPGPVEYVDFSKLVNYSYWSPQVKPDYVNYDINLGIQANGYKIRNLAGNTLFVRFKATEIKINGKPLPDIDKTLIVEKDESVYIQDTLIVTTDETQYAKTSVQMFVCNSAGIVIQQSELLEQVVEA